MVLVLILQPTVVILSIYFDILDKNKDGFLNMMEKWRAGTTIHYWNLFGNLL